MSNTEPNDEELTPAGLRQNRLTLRYREGQRAGQRFQVLVNDMKLSSDVWSDMVRLFPIPPENLRGEDRGAWEAGFANGRHAGVDGELSPSPYMETKGATKT